MSWQKARDAILVVTLLGALGLLPPILPFFDRPISLFGVPLIVVYVFGTWLALIALAFWLSYRLPRHVSRTVVPDSDDGIPMNGEEHH